MSERLGWFLFALDLFLFVGGGIIEKSNPAAGLCMMMAGIVVLLVLWKKGSR